MLPIASDCLLGGLGVLLCGSRIAPTACESHRWPVKHRYVYEGAGSFGSSAVVAQKGEVLRFGATGDVAIRADRGSSLTFVLLAGAPLKEPIVQHGPFVMSTKAQIMQVRTAEGSRDAFPECL